ncbi:hypothetical protein ACFLQ0_00810 [Nitrospinota bacterium]
MTGQIITSILMKIAMAFGVLAFTIALSMGLLSGVSISQSLLRAGMAAGVFAAGGGLASLILFLFFSDD